MSDEIGKLAHVDEAKRREALGLALAGSLAAFFRARHVEESAGR